MDFWSVVCIFGLGLLGYFFILNLTKEEVFDCYVYQKYQYVVTVWTRKGGKYEIRLYSDTAYRSATDLLQHSRLLRVRERMGKETWLELKMEESYVSIPFAQVSDIVMKREELPVSEIPKKESLFRKIGRRER